MVPPVLQESSYRKGLLDVGVLASIKCYRNIAKEGQGVVDIPSGLGEGLSSSIVRILKEYEKALPIEFLAVLMRRRPHEIMEELEALEKQGVVKREQDRVRLLQP